MKKILVFMFLFITSCVNKNIKDDLNSNLSLDINMSFEEIKLKIEEYTINSNYPNIDE